MVLLKRALMQIKTKKMKSVLLLCSFFVISNFIIVMYGVQRNAEDTKQLIRSQMSGVLEYYVDREAFGEYYKSEICFEKTPECYVYELDDYEEATITYNEIKKLTEDERVVAINSKNFTSLSSITLQPIYKSDNYNELNEVTGNEFTLVGNGYQSMIEFQTGDYEIVSGRFYTEEEIQNFSMVALVTEEVAAENNLKPGDIIVLGDEVYRSFGGDGGGIGAENYVHQDGPYSFHLELEVIGIYKNNQPPIAKNDGIFDNSTEVLENKENVILLPRTTLTEYMDTSINLEMKRVYETENFFEDDKEYENTLIEIDRDKILEESLIGEYYLLKDPNHVDQVLSDYDYLNTEFKVLNANNDQYLRLKVPLDLLGEISKMILIIVLVVSILFISLVTTFNFKIREYEFGLQLSLGVTKIRIAIQLLIELMIISTLGFLLSLVSSRIISNQIDSTVVNYMKYESEKIEVDDQKRIDSWEETIYFEEVAPETFFEDYESQWDLKFILFVYFLIISVILISCVIPITILLKQSPKMILMNRE